MPAPTPEQSRHPEPRHDERRRQIRGLLLLAAVVLLFSLFRAHHVFNPGWWRLW
jgi:ferric-dicitrate binding protein FerR (iron transport regulator)